MDIALSKNEALPASFSKGNHTPGRDISREDWEQLKPIIRTLYLEQRQTLAEVAKRIECDHGFKPPTKKQLVYRISAWGFEKNIKKSERREIMERLGLELENSDVAMHLRGRLFDKAKLNRWKRRDKVEGEHLSARTEGVKEDILLGVPEDGPEIRDQDLEENNLFNVFNCFLSEEALGEVRQEVNSADRQTGDLGMQMPGARFYGENDFDWTSVDVIGSPRLTRLTGLYTFECCEGIPDLILSPEIPSKTRIEEVSPHDGAVVAGKEEHSLGSEPCVVRSPAPTKAPQIFEILEAWTQPWLHYKNYAFPASPSRTYDLSALGLVKGPLQLQMSASECKDKLKMIKNLKPANIITLVNSVGGLAQDHYNLNDFVGAEVWFRRCINARMSTMWYKPAQTLWACIRVLDCMLRQDRYEEVKTLHLGLHTKLEKILSREHPIIAGSLELRASLLGALGLLADEEIVLRQVLQSRLETLGMTHPATITALENLGCSLARLKRQAKPQLILETAIQLRLQAMKTSKELGNGEREIVEAMSLLTSGLDSSVGHDDGDKILARAHKLLGNAATSKSEPAFAYYYYKARTYKLQGRIPEAETILRGLLRHHGEIMSNISDTVHADVIDMLAEILNTTGRLREATFWLEKLYLLDVRAYGQIHRFTMSSCKKAGFVYARQRQYEKALRFFRTAKDELAVWNAHNGINRSMEDVMKCFQEIDTWVEKVLGMRAVAGSLAQVSGLEEAEVLGFDDDGRDEMTDHDIPDPLL